MPTPGFIPSLPAKLIPLRIPPSQRGFNHQPGAAAGVGVQRGLPRARAVLTRGMSCRGSATGAGLGPQSGSRGWGCSPIKGGTEGVTGPLTHLWGGGRHEVQAGAGGGDLKALGGPRWGFEQGVPGQRGALGWGALTSRAVSRAWGLPRTSQGSVGVPGDAGGLLHGLGGSVGVSGDAGGLCHRPRGSVGVLGDAGGLP